MIRGMIRVSLLSWFCVGSLLAQDALDPRRFMVHDYTNVVAADFLAMRELEVWDELASSALKMVLPMAEKELGFSLDVIDRATMTMALPGAGEERGEHQRMLVFESKQELGKPQRIESYESHTHGGHVIYARHRGSSESFVWPGRGLHVIGNAKVIEQAIDGERKPGLPSADVMSLSAGRGRRIVHLVADLADRSARRTFLEGLFTDSEWPADDMPTFFAGRVTVTGDEDDRHLSLAVTLRHAKVGEGVKASDKAIDALLERAKGMQELRLFRKILKSAKKETRGSDVVVQVDLGRTRDAIGNLAMVMAPLFLMSGTEAAMEAPAVRVQAVPAAKKAPQQQAEAEKPKPAGGGNR